MRCFGFRELSLRIHFFISDLEKNWAAVFFSLEWRTEIQITVSIAIQ